MPERAPEALAAAFDRAARKAGARYALIGGLAVSAWGEPRATRDVDCLLELPDGAEAAFTAALRSEGLSANPADFRMAREDRTHVTVHDEQGPFHVDCKLARGPEERQQLEEALEVDLPAGRMRVARPEETIAFKLRFGSPQDIRDAQSILHIQEGKLDMDRLRAFAIRLGVTEELESQLREPRGGR